MAIVSGIAAAATIGGALLSSSSNKKAANTAAAASDRATEQSIALQRDIYGQNRDMLNPFVQRGNVAGNAINDLLGLGGTPALQSGAIRPSPNAPQIETRPGMSVSPFGGGFMSVAPWMPVRPPATATPGSTATGGAPATSSPPATPAVSSQQAQENAFRRFLDSTAYRFTRDEGMDALNSGFAGSGLLQSGAAIRSAIDYGQNQALANAFGPYMNLLSQQQGVGLQGAGAVAGVGVNYANNAGQLIMNNASNQANAAIARAQNNPFANALGTLGGFAMGWGR